MHLCDIIELREQKKKLLKKLKVIDVEIQKFNDSFLKLITEDSESESDWNDQGTEPLEETESEN